MRLADVVDEDCDVLAVEDGGEGGVVFVAVRGEVHGQYLDAGIGALLGESGGEALQFGLSARDEDQVVASFRERMSIFFSNAVACACDDGPRAARAEAAKLCEGKPRV